MAALVFPFSRSHTPQLPLQALKNAETGQPTAVIGVTPIVGVSHNALNLSVNHSSLPASAECFSDASVSLVV